MEPVVISETEDYIILNKPSGLLVHGDGKRKDKTLVDWLISEYPDISGVGDKSTSNEQELDRSGIVHRLDEETSGIMVVARNQNSFDYFKKLFMDREIQKEYHAFVWGHFKEDSGVINESIGRNKNDFRRRHAGRGIRGESKEALTNWEVINQFQNEDNEEFSFVRLYPKTGRTHQLRVHMKFIQRPIVSDTLYAPTKLNALGFDRVALHAHKISFLDQNGVQVEEEASYPDDFRQALARYVKI
ncbi:MAG: RluA family pseudouridine synthase [Candidatus Pacebacteria bacterium]|nr:RluA family pseudouridine synthase [Candidatus Paceibacterota bacterium]